MSPPESDKYRPRMTTSMFQTFLSTQARRLLPACIACFVIIAFLSISSKFGQSTNDLSYSASVATGQFPKKIWQTWKVDPLDFEERDSTRARTWVTKNPGHRYEVLTDQNDMYWVEMHYGPAGFNRPDIVYVYRTLTAKIIKADLLRYLIMYASGGYYTDIDVEALRPINRFIPDRYNEKDVDMIIGVEIDQPDYANHTILGPKSQSFCQWTFACKPRLPVMMRLIEQIMKWLHDLSKKQGKPINELYLDFDEVISGTGPSAFTGAILAEMSKNAGEKVTWSSFSHMLESKLVGGILVLTVEAFAAGQGHSDSGNHESKQALVRHHYHASGWPTAHPRYKHPVYGEVERCNWRAECVKAWDENTAKYNAAPPEEQEAIRKAKEEKEAAQAAALEAATNVEVPPP